MVSRLFNVSNTIDDNTINDADNDRLDASLEFERCKDDLIAQFALLEHRMLVYEIEGAFEWSDRAFSAAHGKLSMLELKMRIANGEDKKSATKRTAYAILARDPDVKKISGLTSVCGQGVLVTDVDEGVTKTLLNRYRPGVVEATTGVTDAMVAPWLDHVRRLTSGTPGAADHLLDWFAWLLQNPSRKVRWAPLIHSKQGTGKDIMLRPIIEILGPWNCDDLSVERLDGGFTGYAAKRLCSLGEMKNSSKYSTYDRLKPMVSGTGSGRQWINLKYQASFVVQDLMAMIIFTNHADAMPMESDDRRFYVIAGATTCGATRDERTAYFGPIDKFLNDGGAKHIHGWLLQRDVQAFQHNQPPEPTEAKTEMQREAMSEFGRWLLDQCEVGRFKPADGELEGRTIVTSAEITYYYTSVEGFRHQGR